MTIDDYVITFFYCFNFVKFLNSDNLHVDTSGNFENRIVTFFDIL